MTIAPCLTASGASALEIEPPAENSAISIPLKLSGVASSTVISSFLNLIFFPAERFEDNNFNSPIGNDFLSKISRIFSPTAPVAPTIATLYSFAIIDSSFYLYSIVFVFAVSFYQSLAFFSIKMTIL